jgi:hypothetical protein
VKPEFDAEFVLEMVEATELSTVEGGAFVQSPVPMGDRMTDGCGTMILIDRMFGGIFGPRRTVL